MEFAIEIAAVHLSPICSKLSSSCVYIKHELYDESSRKNNFIDLFITCWTITHRRRSLFIFVPHSESRRTFLRLRLGKTRQFNQHRINKMKNSVITTKRLKRAEKTSLIINENIFPMQTLNQAALLTRTLTYN